MLRLPVIAIALLAAAGLVSGCGESGAEEGAKLTVYASAPLRGAEATVGKKFCAEARDAARQSGSPGGFELRVVCLDASGTDGRWTLAQVGANARRATEDSATVAYLGEPELAARRQSQPIIEAAGIAALGGLSGEAAMTEVAKAIEEGDSGEPRRAVFDAVEG